MIRAPQIFAAAAILAVLVAGCDEQESLTPINVKLNWQHGADFIGFYVARNKGYFEEEGLEVTIHALSEPAKTKDMFEAVAAAEFEFSLAGGSLAETQARGLPLVAIANINKFSPATLFARRESDIVRDSPGMATNFIRATLRGWQWAIENPEMAVDLLIEERPELAEDREFQIASLLASVPLIIPPGAELGAIDCAEWLADPLLADLPGKKKLCTEQLFANATGRAGQ